MRNPTLEEVFDLDSDFHLERYALEAARLGVLVTAALDRAASPFLCEQMARKAATAGAKALEIIERRGSDDLEFFCGIVMPANPPIPPNAKLRLLVEEMSPAPRPVPLPSITIEKSPQIALRRVQWVNVWQSVQALSQDVGSHHHLTTVEGLAGKTLCGREFPTDKGSPSPLAGRWCKRCLNIAYKKGFQKGFTKSIDSVPSKQRY